MFPFLFIFIVFLLILNFSLHRQKRSQEECENLFWEREREANNTRRQDISKLDYISIPLEKIPQNLHTDAEKKLVELSSRKLLNLTGQTNTDLKMQYGVANLEALSEYDANFTELVAVLPAYAQELIDSGQTDSARGLLEFAVQNRADSRAIYELLAGLYLQNGEAERIQELIQSAESLDSMSGRIITGKLQELTGDTN